MYDKATGRIGLSMDGVKCRQRTSLQQWLSLRALGPKETSRKPFMYISVSPLADALRHSPDS